MAITTGRALRRLVSNPSLGFGEGYTDGEVVPVDCSLLEVFDLLALSHRWTPSPERDRHLRQLAVHGWAYRRGVVALWALAAVELAWLLLELAR
jgi:hypothetical protein